MLAFRVNVAVFSFVLLLMAIVLIPVSYFGDKSVLWTKRLIAVAGVAGVIFALSVFWQ